MSHILREIKLSNLTGIPTSGDAANLIKFWDNLWLDMKVIVDPKRGRISCWKEYGRNYYFQQYDKHDHLWCDYGKVWSFFSIHLCLNNSDTKELIQYMVNTTLNYEVNEPAPYYASEWTKFK